MAITVPYCTLDADPRPALGSGSDRLKPVMPDKPMVPAGAPAELRLDAKKEAVILLYPY
jgi:cholesterol oxidase